MVAITESDYVFTHTELMKKRSYFQLHKNRDLCIITLRPPPRWTKWSRGVRTRGLRVGLVGGPRPLLFLEDVFCACINPKFTRQQFISHCGKIDFRRKWNKIRQARSCTNCFGTRSSGHHASSGVATVGIVDKPGCGIFSATMTNAGGRYCA